MLAPSIPGLELSRTTRSFCISTIGPDDAADGHDLVTDLDAALSSALRFARCWSGAGRRSTTAATTITMKIRNV